MAGGGVTSAERQQRKNYLRAEWGAKQYAADLMADDPVKWAEPIALALAHAERHAADAARVGQRRESPL